MDEAARQLAQAEIESLKEFLGDRRLAQQLHQQEADTEAARIAELEAELAQRQKQQDLT